MVKYCDECKWFQPCKGCKEYRWKLGKCLSPNVKVVRGEQLLSKNEGIWASAEREYGNCGEEGKNFELKEPVEETYAPTIWERLRGIFGER